MPSIVMSSRERLDEWLDSDAFTMLSILFKEVSAFSNMICIASDGTLIHESALL